MDKSQHFDLLYKKSQELLKKHNPCKIKDGTCLRGRNGGINFCCHGCHYLKNNGCSVKALTCRTWLCSTALNSLSKEAQYEFYNLEEETLKSGFYFFRGSKTDSLRGKK